MPEMHDLEHLASRADEFEDELFRLLEHASFPDTNQCAAILAMHNLALEHAVALRELIRAGLPTSALGMLRLQYEAVVREIWLLYAASETSITKLVAPLTPESEQAASNSLPAFSIMLSEIEKRGPPAVHRLLKEFKDYSWRPLNSFVHSGIHAVSRHRDGYPIGLLEQAVRQSNNLSHMSAIAVTQLQENAGLVMAVVETAKKFPDCLQLKLFGKVPAVGLG